MDILFTLIVVVVAAALWSVFLLLGRRGETAVLRPLPAYQALDGHVGRAIESDSQLHISLGRASLSDTASPASIASLAVLNKMATDGYANGTPPLVTVGDGTLLPVAQESLRFAHADAKDSEEAGLARFIAAEDQPYVYAGGVAVSLQQNKVLSNVLVGKFGAEIGIITESANRQNMEQVIGSDDITAVSLGSMVTDNLLIGEELLASGAYLDGTTAQIASLQAQDVLRVVAIVGLLITAVTQFIK